VRYRLAVFDFDGTLADSFGFFVSVFNELAARHGFRGIAPEEIPALRKRRAREIMRHVGLPMHRLPAVGRDFIGRMRHSGESIRAFAGVTSLLQDLRSHGLSVAVVSSNDRDNVESILGPEAVAAVHDFDCGASIFGKRSHLRKVVKRSAVKASEAIYIGDQSTDHDAAHAEGMAFGAVAWGYGDFAHLRSLGPEHAFETIEDIRRLLTRGP
jgi:phosphoglycolate phosphatase